MVWDLRGALLKKGEHETARLATFEFRQRARTFRLLAEALDPDADPQAIVGLIARMDDDAALAQLADRFPSRAADLMALYHEAQEDARRQLIEEIGDPSPHRLL